MADASRLEELEASFLPRAATSSQNPSEHASAAMHAMELAELQDELEDTRAQLRTVRREAAAAAAAAAKPVSGSIVSNVGVGVETEVMRKIARLESTCNDKDGVIEQLEAQLREARANLRFALEKNAALEKENSELRRADGLEASRLADPLLEQIANLRQELWAAKEEAESWRRKEAQARQQLRVKESANKVVGCIDGGSGDELSSKQRQQRLSDVTRERDSLLVKVRTLSSQLQLGNDAAHAENAQLKRAVRIAVEDAAALRRQLASAGVLAAQGSQSDRVVLATRPSELVQLARQRVQAMLLEPVEAEEVLLPVQGIDDTAALARSVAQRLRVAEHRIRRAEDVALNLAIELEHSRSESRETVTAGLAQAQGKLAAAEADAEQCRNEVMKARSTARQQANDLRVQLEKQASDKEEEFKAATANLRRELQDAKQRLQVGVEEAERLRSELQGQREMLSEFKAQAHASAERGDAEQHRANAAEQQLKDMVPLLQAADKAAREANERFLEAARAADHAKESERRITEEAAGLRSAAVLAEKERDGIKDEADAVQQSLVAVRGRAEHDASRQAEMVREVAELREAASVAAAAARRAGRKLRRRETKLMEAQETISALRKMKEEYKVQVAALKQRIKDAQENANTAEARAEAAEAASVSARKHARHLAREAENAAADSSAAKVAEQEHLHGLVSSLRSERVAVQEDTQRLVQTLREKVMGLEYLCQQQSEQLSHDRRALQAKDAEASYVWHKFEELLALS